MILLIIFSVAVLFVGYVLYKAACIKNRNDEIYRRQAQEIASRLGREELFSAIDLEI